MIQVICCSSLLSVPGRAGAFSRDFTTSLAPECRSFSGALKIEKLKAPLILGPEGAVDTNTGALIDIFSLGGKVYANRLNRPNFAFVKAVLERIYMKIELILACFDLRRFSK